MHLNVNLVIINERAFESRKCFNTYSEPKGSLTMSLCDIYIEIFRPKNTFVTEFWPTFCKYRRIWSQNKIHFLLFSFINLKLEFKSQVSKAKNSPNECDCYAYSHPNAFSHLRSGKIFSLNRTEENLLLDSVLHQL